MKKILYLMAAGLLVFSACGKDIPGQPDNETPEQGNEAPKVLTFKASMEAMGPQSKGSVGADGKYSWNANDEIAVEFIDGSSQSVFLTFKTEAGDGVFTHTVEGDEDTYTAGTLAFAPASLKSHAGLAREEFYIDKDDFENGLTPLVAVVNGDELPFKHLFAMLRVTFGQVPTQFDSPKVTFISSAGNTGVFSYSLEGGDATKPIAAAGTSTTVETVTLKGVTRGEGNTVTVTVPVVPGVSTAPGFDLQDENGVSIYAKTATSQTFARKTVYVMPTLALGPIAKVCNDAFTEMQGNGNLWWGQSDEKGVTVQTGGWSADVSNGEYIYMPLAANATVTLTRKGASYPKHERTLGSVPAAGTLVDYTFTFGEGLKTTNEHFVYTSDQDGGWGLGIYGWNGSNTSLYGNWDGAQTPTGITTMWENGRAIRMYDMDGLAGYIVMKGAWASDGNKKTGNLAVTTDDSSRGWIIWGLWHHDEQEGVWQVESWSDYLRDLVWK